MKKFNMKTPCKDCPFRSDIKPFITASRAREIIQTTVLGEAHFHCHKTLKYGGSADEEHIDDTNGQVCAGSLIMAERLGKVPQMVRIAERLGMYDHTQLDMAAPVYKTPAAMIEACGKAAGKKRVKV